MGGWAAVWGDVNLIAAPPIFFTGPGGGGGYGNEFDLHILPQASRLQNWWKQPCSNLGPTWLDLIALLFIYQAHGKGWLFIPMHLLSPFALSLVFLWTRGATAK